MALTAQLLHPLGLLNPHTAVLPLEVGIHLLGDADLPAGAPPHGPRLDQHLNLKAC